MGKMNLLLAFLFIFIFSGISYAQDQEEIVLTTYYPAPYGDYDMLVLEPQNGPPTNNPPNGAMYFDDGSHASRERGLYIFDSTDGGWRHASVRFGIPSGTIVMFSGSSFDGTGLGTGVLLGWALCNGNNGTPNLRNRFVVGAGATYAVGATGGTTTHKHGIGSHKHRVRGNTGKYKNTQTTVRRAKDEQFWGHALFHSDHIHSIDFDSQPSSGDTTSASSLPPYYALCFIMKL
jgi:hypothetical protein